MKKLDLTAPPSAPNRPQSANAPKEQSKNETIINGTVTVAEEHRVPRNLAPAAIEVPPKPWSNLFQKNRSAVNGMPMSYIPPHIINVQIVVQLDKDEAESKTEKWKCALIVYILGEIPGYNTMK